MQYQIGETVAFSLTIKRGQVEEDLYCFASRKRALLLFLHTTKQRLLRLLIVVKWANKV